MALQFALNRLFIVTANMGTLFENVRPGRGDERGSGEPVALSLVSEDQRSSAGLLSGRGQSNGLGSRGSLAWALSRVATQKLLFHPGLLVCILWRGAGEIGRARELVVLTLLPVPAPGTSTTWWCSCCQHAIIFHRDWRAGLAR